VVGASAGLSFRAQHLREVDSSGAQSRAHADCDGEQQDESRGRGQRGRIQRLNSEEKCADNVRTEIREQQPGGEPESDEYNAFPEYQKRERLACRPERRTYAQLPRAHHGHRFCEDVRAQHRPDPLRAPAQDDHLRLGYLMTADPRLTQAPSSM
jgi:hypothetical protein